MQNMSMMMMIMMIHIFIISFPISENICNIKIDVRPGADPGIHQGGGGHCGGRKPTAGEKIFFTSRLLYVSFTSFLVN